MSTDNHKLTVIGAGVALAGLLAYSWLSKRRSVASSAHATGTSQA